MHEQIPSIVTASCPTHTHTQFDGVYTCPPYGLRAFTSPPQSYFHPTVTAFNLFGIPELQLASFLSVGLPSDHGTLAPARSPRSDLRSTTKPIWPGDAFSALTASQPPARRALVGTGLSLENSEK